MRIIIQRVKNGSVTVGEKIVGTHDLSQNSNRLILNYKKDNLLTVYGSTFCSDNPGSITITEQDTVGNTISGTFTARVCNNGMMGELGEKTVQQCAFNKVTLVAL